MKAVALTESKDLHLVEVDEPRLESTQVLVRPHFCGICGSDLHAKENSLFRPGVIMGHEFAGEIVSVGTEVKEWAVGQRVTINPNGHVCNRCAACTSGRPNLCVQGTQSNPAGVAKNGGMAEVVALHPSYLHELPDTVDTRRGAWTEPLAVAVRAVRTSPVRVGDSVAVIGGGPVGQLVQQVLRRAGAGRITMIEPSTYRGEVSTQLGADLVLTPAEARARVDAGEIAPVDHVFECSGHPTALQLATDLLAAGGSVRLVGMAPVPVAFDTVMAIAKEIRILTGFIYVDEFAQSIPLLATGAIDVDILTSAVMPLDRYADAFDSLRNPESSMKVLIDAQA